jgi:DUF1016 N-terminal domain
MEPIKNIEALHSEARQIIETGRRAAYHAVNSNMVKTYWELGQLIVEEEQQGKTRADYGKYLIAELAERLTSDFGKGYEKRNLFYMKQFYLAYPIVNALRSQLTWTHYRQFYLAYPIGATVSHQLTWSHIGYEQPVICKPVSIVFAR